ncbi:MAG: hypothetical protein IJK64_01990 [Clostridia bacterium]|nr:hypothetical protein [Clostridia bacterium]
MEHEDADRRRNPLFSESLSPCCKRDKRLPEVTTAECRRNKVRRPDRVKVAERRAKRGKRVEPWSIRFILLRQDGAFLFSVLKFVSYYRKDGFYD